MTRPWAARLVAVLALLAATAAAAWALWPVSWGGSTGYVTTTGISMRPLLTAGDLVVLRPADSYRVGDVVAYRSTVLRSVVLHRIVAVEGTALDPRYVLKGDRNDWLDPDRPGDAELVGRMVVRIPQGGTFVESFARPGPLLVLAVISLLTSGTGAVVGRLARRRARADRARRTRRRSPGAWRTRPPDGGPLPGPSTALPRQRTPSDGGTRGGPGRRGRAGGAPSAARPGASGASGGMRAPMLRVPAPWMLPLLLAAAVTCGAVAALAVGAGPVSTTTRQLSWTQLTELTYGATTAPGAAYPDGTVTTGDPVYLKLVDAIDLHVTSTAGFEPAPPGTREPLPVVDQVLLGVQGTLSHPGGWSRDVDLTLAPVAADDPAAAGVTAGGDPTTVTARAAGTVRVPLRRITALLDEVRRETGLTDGGHVLTVTVTARVLGGGGEVLDGTTSAALSFVLQPTQVVLTAADTEALAQGGGARAVTRAATGGVTVTVVRPARWSVGAVGVPVATVADVATPLAVACAAAAVLVGSLGLRGGRRPRPAAPTAPPADLVARRTAATLRRHRALVVPGTTATVPQGRAVVTVDSLETLVRIAQRYERFVVHVDGGPGHMFLVDDDTTIYRFRCPRPAPAGPPDPWGPDAVGAVTGAVGHR